MGVQTQGGIHAVFLNLLTMSPKVVFSHIWGGSKSVFHIADSIDNLAGRGAVEVSIHVLRGGLGC